MAKKPKLKEVVLVRTVNYGGKYYPPGEVLKFPGDIADELIDVGAAEPVLAVASSKEQALDGPDDE